MWYITSQEFKKGVFKLIDESTERLWKKFEAEERRQQRLLELINS